MKITHSGHALPAEANAACEDAWIVRERRDATIAIVADGVGSCREGGAAARRAVEMIADFYSCRPRSWTPRRALADFTAQASRHLHAESLVRHGAPEMACTLAAVVVENGRLYGCNVGDSAVFHFNPAAGLQPLSAVHAHQQPGFEHVLTRALGIAPEVEPHYFEAALADGDRILLCSDGVTAALAPERLAALLGRQASARNIVTAAQEVGRNLPELRDDACAIVLEVLDARGQADRRNQTLVVLSSVRAGDVVAEHRLIRPLANGHDRVWLAEDAQGGRVVLKFPPAEAAENESLRDAFVREAWNAGRLSSPDLVRAWTPETPELPCYVMEFIDAPTLRSALRYGRLGVEEARELAQFFVRTGQFLERHELVHGDLKPDNVLVLSGPNGKTFRLLDLGSAAEAFSVTSRAGTPSYLAPERFRGSALSERTEIFSIGVTLYEALTGAFPYGEIERFQNPRFDALPKRVTRLNPAVPEWFEAVILRAIDPDPERRYQHFSELGFDLANPSRVAPHHRKDAALLERDPLLFYKFACVVLLLLNLWQLWLLHG